MAKHVCRIYRMNVYSMNVIRTYYIHHVVIYCHSFTNPLPWPHGIVKHPSYAHFRIWPEEVSHTGTFLWVLWIQTYYLLPHTDFAYYIRGVCDFRCSHSIYKWIIESFIQWQQFIQEQTSLYESK